MNPSVFLYLFLSVLLLEVQSHTIYKNGQHSNINLRSRRGVLTFFEKIINSAHAVVEKGIHVAVNTVKTVQNKVKTDIQNFRCGLHKVGDKVFHHNHVIDPCSVAKKPKEILIMGITLSESNDHIKPESEDINTTTIINNIDESVTEISPKNKTNSNNDNGDKDIQIYFGDDDPSNIKKVKKPVEVKREDQNAEVVNQLIFSDKKDPNGESQSTERSKPNIDIRTGDD
uniref:Uncharacterized protein LOC114340572 isoform X2 n=1 Tax=Diabrotica virgifera virgifera TaxID=50390 RepID=A0A6P7GPK7_DIAVI